MTNGSLLNIIKVSFTFPASTMKLLRDHIPARKRSGFVAEVVEKEIRRRALSTALTETHGILSDKDYSHWSTKEKISKWIRNRRAKDQERLKRHWKKTS